VLVLAGLGTVATGGVACGEDVLVARFELTSNTPDAGVIEEAAADAGRVNGQSINAERARARARWNDRVNDHTPRPNEADENH
jgi:hypothetical protein